MLNNIHTESLLRRRKVAATICAGIGVVGLVGCSDQPDVTTGVPAKVVAHEYDDRDVTTTFVLVGKVVVPITNIDPEHFYLKVEQCGHEEFKDQNANGCALFTVLVNQDTYNQFQDGETVVFND